MIVLAGGIGSGKSVVARTLRLKGFGVYDCDFEARRLMEQDPGLVEQMKAIAGEAVYGDSGKLDRKYLGELIFGNREIRERVNRAVHSAVRSDVERWLRQSPANIFVETAIAAESGLYAMAERVWLVQASEKTRISRVKSRDCRSEDEIRRIMGVQAMEEETLRREGIAVDIILNDTADCLLGQIDKLIDRNSK